MGAPEYPHTVTHVSGLYPSITTYNSGWRGMHRTMGYSPTPHRKCFPRDAGWIKIPYTGRRSGSVQQRFCIGSEPQKLSSVLRLMP